MYHKDINCSIFYKGGKWLHLHSVATIQWNTMVTKMALWGPMY
jgi:hypothetical protein